MSLLALDDTIRLLTGHEFNTPLNGIMGFAELAKMEIDKANSQKSIECLDYIIQSANRLNNLMERLRIWSTISEINEIEYGEHFLVKESEIMDIVSQFRDNKYPFIQLKRNNMFESYGRNACRIYGSERLFKQALVEIADNCFKFSFEQKPVSLALNILPGKIQIDFNNYCAPEISSALLKSYTPYKQFYRNKFEQQGIGLGIAISKKALSLNQCLLRFNQIEPGLIHTQILYSRM